MTRVTLEQAIQVQIWRKFLDLNQVEFNMPSCSMKSLFQAGAMVSAGFYLALLWASKKMQNKYAVNLLMYIHLATHGFTHMALSSESSYKSPPDPDIICGKEENPQGKTVVFIRHGESVWNEVFNRGFNIGFIFRFWRALFREALLACNYDSVFFDTPLSHFGCSQAEELNRFIHDQEVAGLTNPTAQNVVNILKGKSDGTSAIFVVSNLRRAIQTAIAVMWQQVKDSKRKLFILSSLQESSRNIDTQSILHKHEFPKYSFADEEKLVHASIRPHDVFDVTYSFGNKSIGSKLIDRQLEFSRWVFEQKSDVIVVAGGHSLWFKQFFKNMLPRSVDHISKKKKLSNCGVVAFQLTRGTVDGKTIYRIPPESMVNVYGGFK